MEYDRRILLPYLKNVYELKYIEVLIKQKILDEEQEINSLRNTEETLNAQSQLYKKMIADKNAEAETFVCNKSRKLEKLENSSEKGGPITNLLSGLLCVVLWPFYLPQSWIAFAILCLYLYWKKISFGKAIFILLVLIISIGLVITLLGLITDKNNEEKRKIEISSIKDETTEKSKIIKDIINGLSDDIEKNEAQITEIETVDIPKHKENIALLQKKVSANNTILQSALQANIIPARYRNYDCLAYLWVYFSTSRAKDLDMIIQSLLLDDIKMKLQEIQAQLNQVLKNQDSIISQLNEIQDSLYRIEDTGCRMAEQLNQIGQQLDSISRQAEDMRSYNYQTMQSVAKLEDNEERKAIYMDMLGGYIRVDEYLRSGSYL